MDENDFNVVRCLEFLDTHGDQITPGSDVIGKYLKLDFIGHNRLSLLALGVGSGDRCGKLCQILVP
jgi:hypothetical protein